MTATEAICDRACTELLEHCDSVRIFITEKGEGGETTRGYTHGGGNIYAQTGQIRDWVLTQDEYVKEKARIEQRSEEP